MDTDIQLREAISDDLDAILRLNRGALPAVGDVDDRELWRLVDQAATTLVVEDTGGGGVVAFAIVFGPGAAYESPNYRFFAERYPAFRYVDRVVVDPAYARHGIGSRLYERVVDDARSAGTPVVTAEVNVQPPNQASLAFHAAHGFEAVGEQDTEGGAKRVRLLVRDLA